MINYYVFLYGTGCSYSDHTNQIKYFDRYGNYFFPTDVITGTPNIVTGTPSGCRYIYV